PFPLGAFHSAEIQFVFGHPMGSTFDADEMALHAAMSGYWTRFAAQNGDPNGAGSVTWPAYDTSGARIVLDATIAAGVDAFTDTIEGAEHRNPCEEIPYPAHPPSAGPHYYIWASFLTYASPVPWPFLVHSLEHGAVVLAYHCENDADCDAVRTEFASIIAAE